MPACCSSTAKVCAANNMAKLKRPCPSAKGVSFFCVFIFVFEFQSFSKAYSKAHITTSANKNTQVTPTVVNIVLHLHMPFTIIFLSPLQVTISIFILNILYHSFVFCIQYSCENFLLFLQILCFWIWLLYTLKRG